MIEFYHFEREFIICLLLGCSVKNSTHRIRHVEIYHYVSAHEKHSAISSLKIYTAKDGYSVGN